MVPEGAQIAEIVAKMLAKERARSNCKYLSAISLPKLVPSPPELLTGTIRYKYELDSDQCVVVIAGSTDQPNL